MQVRYGSMLAKHVYDLQPAVVYNKCPILGWSVGSAANAASTRVRGRMCWGRTLHKPYCLAWRFSCD